VATNCERRAVEVRQATRVSVISAIVFAGGLSLVSWALFTWHSIGFVTGPESTLDGRIGGFFILLLGIGLGFMVMGVYLFIHRERPTQDPASSADSDSETSDAPYKPFERLWQNATIVTFSRRSSLFSCLGSSTWTCVRCCDTGNR
jgi:hypothetical protein